MSAGFKTGDGGFCKVSPQNLFAAGRDDKQRMFALDTFLDGQGALRTVCLVKGLSVIRA